MIPSVSEIEALHRKYAASTAVFTLVFTHCQIVWQIAGQLVEAKNLRVDRKLVQAGALLHDIGAYKLIDANKNFDKENYIKHGIFGYEIMRNEGLDEALCEIAQRHTGAGITKKQIEERNLPLPLQDFVAITIEERLVMYADKFHSKTPRFNSYETYTSYVRKFGSENEVRFKEMADEFGIPDLQTLAEKYKHPIV